MTDPTLFAVELGLSKEAELLLLVGSLVAILLIGAAAISFLNKWRKRQLDDDTSDVTESVGSFRQMYENGELSKEEYERILQKTADNAKKKWGKAGATPEAPKQEIGGTQKMSKLGTTEMPKPPIEGDPSGSG